MLEFGDWTFKVEPKELQAGRIFPSGNKKSVQTEGLSSEIFYYVDERYGGKPTHPLADLFFVTLQNELVLINITGTVEEVNVHEKFDKLKEFIDKHNQKLTKYELFGVVLAPCLYQKFVPRLTEEQAPTQRNLRTKLRKKLPLKESVL